MKIAELIALLSEYDLNSRVRISTDLFGAMDIREIDDRCCMHSTDPEIILEG